MIHFRSPDDAVWEAVESPASEAGWIERRAKLFEAGDYPDKGVSITPESLERIAREFSGPVPVLVEHSPSPLRIGELVRVEARGGELFGTLRLSREANALIERSGARALSLGLSPDLARIEEVSLVAHPRVPSARLFGEASASGAGSDDERLAEHVRQGRLLPAQVPYARALLRCAGTVEFGAARSTVRALVLALLERQAPHALFAQTPLSAPSDSGESALPPEEAEFYRRHFPDLGLDEIARHRRPR